MKVLILSYFYPPDLCAGSFRTKSLVEELSQKDKIEKITILSSTPNRYDSFRKGAESFESSGKIDIYRANTPRHGSSLFGQIRSFMCYATFALNKQKHEKYDVVFATSSRLLTALLGHFISRVQKSRLCLDIRDLFVDTVSSVYPLTTLRPVLWLIQIIEKKAFESADYINFVSEGFKEYVLNYDLKNVTYFTNGIDQDFLESNLKLNSEKEKKIITYAGNIGKGQGLEKLIPELSQELGDAYEFNIYGDGGRKLRLSSELSKNRIKNVKCFNPVPQSELPDIYQNSDFLLINLNTYDAFLKVLPSKVFEYAASNKPIIAGVEGYAAEFIKENIEEVILTKSCDSKQMAQQIKAYNINKKIDRVEFKEKFNRKAIMNNFAENILSLSGKTM